MAFKMRLALSRILEGAEPRGFSLTLHNLFCSLEPGIWETMRHAPLTSQGGAGVVLKRIAVTLELQDWLTPQKFFFFFFFEVAARTRGKTHCMCFFKLCYFAFLAC